MKISSLFESYKIEYDSSKKKNRSSIVDFIKENNISTTDIQQAIIDIKKSQEFKKLLSLDFIYKSSALQEKRATLFFESADGNTQVTCYATGQARRANRGGFNNSMFIASPIPTLPPTQIDDLPTHTEVMIDNLKKSLKSIIGKFERSESKKADGMSVVDERMKTLGFPDGFRIYLDGAPKNNKYIMMDEGQVVIRAEKSGEILVLDFGNNSELGPNVDIGSISGVWGVVIRGSNIKSYKGLEKIFNTGLTKIIIDTETPNLKELAKTMSSNNIKYVYFMTNPLEIPLLSIPKICHDEVGMDRRASAVLLNDKEIFEVLMQINKVMKQQMDILDLQDYLIDNGYEKTAKP